MSARTPSLRAAWCLPLLLLAGCPTDPRELEFGAGHGSSNGLGPPTAGRAGAGAGSPPLADAGEASVPTGGTSPVAGAGGGGVPSAPVGGDDAGGEPPVTGGSLSGGSAGATGGGGATAGGGGAAGGGSGGTGGGSLDGGPCGDLDQNGVQDCDETVALNARFDSTATSWLADPGVTQVWRAEDARGSATSGALGVTFTTSGTTSSWALAAAGQCQAAWSDDTFVVGARVLVPQGQAGGRGQLELAYFDNDGCTGTVLSSQTAAFSSQVGAWQALHKKVTAPPGTRSLLLRLAAVKPGMQPSLEVRFDDVLFYKN